jgi:hypothetical protein
MAAAGMSRGKRRRRRKTTGGDLSAIAMTTSIVAFLTFLGYGVGPALLILIGGGFLSYVYESCDAASKGG